MGITITPVEGLERSGAPGTGTSRTALTPIDAALKAAHSIQAAAGPRYESTRPGIPDFSLTAEQVEVDAAVEEVGWLGYYAAVVSTLGSMCEFYPQYWNGSDWEDRDGSYVHAEWREFFKPAPELETFEQQAWVARDLELFLTIGEFAAVPRADDLGRFQGWLTAHPLQLQKGQRPGTFGMKMREDARPGTNGWIDGELAHLVRAWVPQRKWPDQAKVPLARVLPEVRLFKSVVANLQRASDSRLLMNGIFYIPTNEDDLEEGEQAQVISPFMTDAPETPDGGGLGQLIESMSRFARRAFEDPNGSDVAKATPFPFPHHSEPKIIDLGRAVDEDTLETLSVIIESAARGIDIPMDFLLAGVGEANHWNSAEKRRAVNGQAVIPNVERYLAWWTTRFRRYLGEKGVDEPERWRMWRNPDPITHRPDNATQVLVAHGQIGFKREVIAETVGKSADDLVPLPDEMSEAEFIQAMIGATKEKQPQSVGPEGAEVDEPTIDNAARESGQLTERQILTPGGEDITDNIAAAALAIVSGS